MQTYDVSWENWCEQDLAPGDLARIRALIPESGVILDAGCGDGYLLAALAGLAPVAIGIDLSAKALRLAQQRLDSNFVPVQAFLERLPLADKSVDYAVCAHTLEHVRDLEAVVEELKRVTRKRLLILVPAQPYVPYTEDYHLHFFPEPEDLIKVPGLSQGVCIKYRNPSGEHKYQGDLLLLNVDLQ